MTYKQLFSRTKTGRLAADSRRRLRVLISFCRERSQRITDHLPAERTSRYDRPTSQYTFIHLGPQYERMAMEIYQEAHGSKKRNVRAPKPALETGLETIPFQYRGSFKGWHGSYHIPTYKAICRAQGRLVGYVVGAVTGSAWAPKGFHWADVDDHLALVHSATGEECHVACHEVVDWEEHKDHIVSDLKSLIARRKRQAEQESATLKELTDPVADATISMPIARRAGNCEAGISAFCRKLGLNPRGRYTVREVVTRYHRASVSSFEEQRFIATLRYINASLQQAA